MEISVNKTKIIVFNKCRHWYPKGLQLSKMLNNTFKYFDVVLSISGSFRGQSPYVIVKNTQRYQIYRHAHYTYYQTNGEHYQHQSRVKIKASMKYSKIGRLEIYIIFFCKFIIATGKKALNIAVLSWITAWVDYQFFIPLL